MMIALILQILVCAGLLLHAWTAYSVTGILPGYPGSFYWFIIPHLVLVPLSAVLVVLDTIQRTRETFVVSLICLSCLLLTWLFASVQWPGGDDGPRMVWVFGIGAASLLNTAIGLLLIYVAHRLYKKSTQATEVNRQKAVPA